MADAPDNDDVFNGLRMSIEQMRQELQNDEDENDQAQLGDVGTLFNSFRARNGATGNPRRQPRGNHPSRVFVFLGSHNPSEIDQLSNCETKKVKFPSNSTPEEIHVLLRRELPTIGTTSRIIYYKSRSTGNHALHRVGENLDGKQIVSHFKYASTKVYIGLRSVNERTSTITRAPDAIPTTDTPFSFAPTPTLTSTPQSSSTNTTLPSFSHTATSTTSASTIPIVTSTGTTLTTVTSITLVDSDDDLLASAIHTPPRRQQEDDDEGDSQTTNLVTRTGSRRSAFSTGHYGSASSLLPGMQVGTIGEDCSDRGLYTDGLLLSNSVRCISLARDVIGYGGPMFLSHNFKSLCHLIYYSLQPAVIMILNNDQRLTAFEKEVLRNLHQWYVQKKDCKILFWITSKNSKEGRQALKVFRCQSFEFPQMLITGASLRLQSTPTLVERFSGAQICTSELDFSISSAYQSLEMISLKRVGYDQEHELKRRQEEELSKSMLNKQPSNCENKEKESTAAVSKDDGAGKANNCVDKEEGNDAAVSKDDGAEMIRAARKQRLQPEANQEVGVKVRVATPGGQLTRYFSPGGAYQEVYDWLGSDSNNPLYFIVENFDKDIMSPNQPIDHQNQILRLVEMSKQELTERFGCKEEIVFKGTMPASNEADNSTIINEELAENRTIGGENGKKEMKEDHERKERLKAERKALKRRKRKLRLKEAKKLKKTNEINS